MTSAVDTINMEKSLATGSHANAQTPSLSGPAQMGTTTSPPLRRMSRLAKRPLVYVTRRIPQKGMDVVLGACDVKQWDAEEPVPRGELLMSVVGAYGILCMQGDCIDADVLDAAGPSLQVVATTASSTGHIDVGECKARGIQVLTCPHQPTETLADLTVALVLLTIKETQTDEERLVNLNLLAPDLIPTGMSPSSDGGTNSSLQLLTNARTQSRPRLIKQMSEERLAFQWNRGRPGNADSSTWRNIVKKSFGIYGLTRLGLSVAQLLNSLGVSNVMVADQAWDVDTHVKVPVVGSGSASHFRMVTMDELLEKSEVLCVCDSDVELPEKYMAEEDHDLDDSQAVFSKEAFEKMNPGAILVAPRSYQAAINYVDLYAALRDGKIRAAGLNDCNQEPVPLAAPLHGLGNCVFMPQTQESVYDVRHKVSVLIAENLTQALLLPKEKMDNM